MMLLLSLSLDFMELGFWVFEYSEFSRFGVLEILGGMGFRFQEFGGLGSFSFLGFGFRVSDLEFNGGIEMG